MKTIKREYYESMLGLFIKCEPDEGIAMINSKGEAYIAKYLGIDPYIEAVANKFSKHFLKNTSLTKEDLDLEMSYCRELDIKDEFFSKENRDDPNYFKRALELIRDFHEDFVVKHVFTGDKRFAHLFVTNKDFASLSYEDFLFELTFVDLLMSRLGAVLWLALNKFHSYGKLVEPKEHIIKEFKNYQSKNVGGKPESKHNQDYYDQFIVYDVDEYFEGYYISEIDMDKYDSDTYIARKEYKGYPMRYINYVFNEEDCKLKTIHFKNDIQFLEDCFQNATQLENIIVEGEILQVKCGTFEKSKKVQTVLDGVVYVKVNDNPYYICLSYQGGAQNVRLHPDCVVVAERAFQYSKITGIHFSNVKYIGDFAVSDCENLKSVVMTDATLTLGESGFASHSKNLSRIIFSNSIKKIECDICIENEALIEVNLPSKLEEITNAFTACKKLRDIRFPASCKQYGWFTISDCPNIKKVYVPKGAEYEDLSFKGIQVIEY